MTSDVAETLALIRYYAAQIESHTPYYAPTGGYGSIVCMADRLFELARKLPKTPE